MVRDNRAAIRGFVALPAFDILVRSPLKILRVVFIAECILGELVEQTGGASKIMASDAWI